MRVSCLDETWGALGLTCGGLALLGTSAVSANGPKLEKLAVRCPPPPHSAQNSGDLQSLQHWQELQLKLFGLRRQLGQVVFGRLDGDATFDQFLGLQLQL